MRGIVLVLTAAFCWGISGAIAKFMFNNDFSPFVLVQVRLTLGWLLLGLVLSLKYPHLLKLGSWRQFVKLAVLGILGTAMLQFTYLYTISLTSVGVAIFLQYLAPIFVAVYELIFGGKRLSVFVGSALALAVLGSIGILTGNVNGGISVSSLGLISGLSSALFFSFYTIFGQRLVNDIDSWTVLFYSFGFGALFWLIAIPPWTVGYTSFSMSTYGFFLYMASVATVIPFGLFYMALQYVDATKAQLTATTEPVIATVSAFLLLGEQMTSLQMLGSLLVLTAVVILQLEPKSKVKGDVCA